MRLLLPVLASVLAFTGCTIPLHPGSAEAPSTEPIRSAAAPGALVGSDWLANELASALGPQQTIPSLRFDLRGVSGDSGCNRFFGPMRAEGDRLRLGPLASTRKACLESAMQLEHRYLMALENVRRARIEDGRLVLLDDKEVPLLRLDPAPEGSTQPAAPQGQPVPAVPDSAPPARTLDSVAAARGVTLIARGNEPGWRVEIGPDHRIDIVYDYGTVRARFPSLAPRLTSGSETVYQGESGGHRYQVTVRRQECIDDMSGENHPFTVLLRVDGQERRGCGAPPLP